MTTRTSQAPFSARGDESASLRPPRTREEGQALVAAMCHEFRTPLNAILGFSQLLSADSTLSPVASRRIQGIERAGMHLLRLVEEALEVSLIESGQSQVHLAAFDLGAVLEEVRDLFEAEAEKKGLTLEFRVAADTPTWIISDPLKFRQILINLVGNAVKFTGEGSVLVLVSADDPVLDQCQLKIQVIDTGPGIDTNEQQVVFEKFARGLNHAHLGGTGLGLSISQHYARLMGGRISLESALGRGSVFRFQLPITWLRYPVDDLENGAASSPMPSSRKRRAASTEESRESGTFEALVRDEIDERDISLDLARALTSAALAGDRDELLKLIEQATVSTLTQNVVALARNYEYRKIVDMLKALYPHATELIER